MSAETCATCRNWKRAPCSPRGHCHRHAPSLGRFGHGTWPETREDDWCGSYKASPAIAGETSAEAGKEA